jgi:signal transduction histidine kinase
VNKLSYVDLSDTGTILFPPVTAVEKARKSGADVRSGSTFPEVDLGEALAGGPRRLMRSGWVGRCFAYALTTALLGPGVLVVLAAALVASLLVAATVVGVPVAVGFLFVAIPLGRFERHRLRLVLPVSPEDPHSLPCRPGLRPWVMMRLAEPATRREFTYLLLTVVFAGASALTLGFVLFTVALCVLPVILWLISPDVVMFGHDVVLTSPGQAVPFVPLGLLLVGVGIYLVCLVTFMQSVAARVLLGGTGTPSRRDAALPRRRLAETFELERVRIERNLHDGVQPHLIVLATTLSRAEYHVPPGEAQDLLAKAHEQLRDALQSLREASYTIRPRLLTDRGLAAAVGQLAGVSPIRVQADIDLPHRLPHAVESAAYFIVVEALANAMRHGHARTVRIDGRVEAGDLVLDIQDDGHGIIDPSGGTGLSGLAERTVLLGGTFEVASAGDGSRVQARIPFDT